MDLLYVLKQCNIYCINGVIEKGQEGLKTQLPYNPCSCLSIFQLIPYSMNLGNKPYL